MMLVGLLALIVAIVILSEREMDDRFPVSRKHEKARMMSEEYRNGR